MRPIIQGIKSAIKALIPPGTPVRIVRGPLRGYRYIVDENTGWAPIYGGWEPAAVKAYQFLVRSGDVVFDLGANTGIHTLLFSKITGRGGKVVAFEPLPANVDALRFIVRINKVTNVEIRMEAVSDQSCPLWFSEGLSTKEGKLESTGTTKGFVVQAQSLDNLIECGKVPTPDFIKVDIEGAESAALRGFQRNITKSHPTMAVELHTPAEDIAVGGFLHEHGYRLFRLGDRTAKETAGQTQLLAPVARHELGWPNIDGVWGTIIAIHPSRVTRVPFEMATLLRSE